MNNFLPYLTEIFSVCSQISNFKCYPGDFQGSASVVRMEICLL